MAGPVHLGVLISGSGTNLQAIIDAIEGGRLNATIRVVISNRADAGGLERARRHGLPAVVKDHRGFASREDYDRALLAELSAHGVELVILAGFMRIITRVLIDAFPGKIMNIHPALLPSFPGLHAQRQALEHGVRIAGATVHFVDEQPDHGPIIIQGAVPVFPDDTEDELRERILGVEHEIYPRAIQLYAEGRLDIQGRRVMVRNEPRERGARLVAPRVS